MTRPPNDRGRTAWIALIAVAALIGGIAVAISQWKATAPPAAESAPPAAAAPEGDPGDEVIDRALSQIPVDSTELRARWVEVVPGADLSGLSPGRQELFVRFANAQRCTCGCGFTLAGCRAFDPTCEVSGPRVTALIDSLRAGRVPSARGLRARP